jgi:two-component system, NarL family, nitrate/nitrite response regulator NarL
MADLRLLVVAADPLARAGLAALLREQPGFDVIGQLGDLENLPSEVEVYRPDALIWDLGWDPEESLSALEEMAAEANRGAVPIIALLPNDEHALAVWSTGVPGILYRDVSSERLLPAIRAVVGGLAVFDPPIAGALVPGRPPEELVPGEELTPRELQVLQLLAEGLANKAIAQALNISEHTVKFHVNAIMSKLGAQSRTAAVVRATRLGLILL